MRTHGGESSTPLSEENVHCVLLRGSATIGNTLTAGVFHKCEPQSKIGPITYQWQVFDNTIWVDIPGAINASIALDPALLGKKIRLLAMVGEASDRHQLLSSMEDVAAKNPIVLENQNTGTSEWKIDNLARNREIEGYADATSVNAGEPLNLRISLSHAGRYDLHVYRLGYYGGTGGRLMSSAVGLEGARQADPIMANPETRLVECRWNISHTLETSASWTSGLYVIKLTESRNSKQTIIPFVLRSDGRPSDIGFQDAVNTAQAYNTYGGFCAYDATSENGMRAHQLSFDRPYTPVCLGFSNSDGYNSNNMLSWEYNMVRWLESQGYDLSYYTNVDVHNNRLQLLCQRTFLSVGHDEYWSMEQRTNVERARDLGIHLAFYSANSVYWQVRFDRSSIGQNGRTMSIYKDVSGIGIDTSVDPITQTNPLEATTLFRSKEVNRPENSLLGVGYVSDHPDIFRGFDFVIKNSNDPCFAHTGLKDGDKLTGLVGYEWDAVLDNDSSPDQVVILAQSPTRANPILPPLPGNTRPNVSHAVRYTAPSGAIVFSVGSIQWVWALDDELVTRPPKVRVRWRSKVKSWLKGLIYPDFRASMPKIPHVDSRAQQIAVNIFAEMGIKPQTPSPGVILKSKETPINPPNPPRPVPA